MSSPTERAMRMSLGTFRRSRCSHLHAQAEGRPMKLRVISVILICAAGPSMAFPLGIWVASGGSLREKSGPGAPARDGTGRVLAHLNPVRVIAPGTLDGQSIPGKGGGSADHSRGLSPIYPTSPSADRDISVSQGLAPAAQAIDARAEQASPVPGDTPSQEISSGRRALDPQIFRHEMWMGATVFDDRPRRRRVANHRREHHFARPANPIALFARLLFH
jgi:hypothetical protein